MTRRASLFAFVALTEFVFRFRGWALEHSDLAQVQRVIAHWLPFGLEGPS